MMVVRSWCHITVMVVPKASRLERKSEVRKMSSRGRPGVKNWAQVAQFVRDVLASNPSVDMETAIGRVPSSWWMSADNRRLSPPKPETVQRWVAALKNIERIEDDTDKEYVDYVRQLRSAPVAAVELICRWHSYDSFKALKAARVIVDGRWPLEKLREEEEKARKKSTSRVSGRQYAHKLRGQVRDWAATELGADFEAKDRQRGDPPADVLFARKSDPAKLSAVLIFGPYTDTNEYDNRYTSFLTLVAGLAIYCERVVAVVPDAGSGYWQWLHQHDVEGANIDFYAAYYHWSAFKPVKLRRPTPPFRK